MMRMTGCGWAGLVLGVGIVPAGLFGAGLYLVLNGPDDLRVMGGIWAVVFGLVLVGAGFGFAAFRRKQAVVRDGTPGSALVQGMTQTGTYINEMPVVEFDLQVSVEGRSPYSATAKATVPHIALGSLGVGRSVPVRVDPDDRERVVITGFGDVGQLDARDNPALRAEIERILGRSVPPGTSLTVDDPEQLRLVQEAAARLGSGAAAPPAPPSGAGVDDDAVDARLGQLERLADLHRQGVLTDEEFAAQKADILQD